jgi:tetratricopeptide (TPR) repeat protein
VRASCLLLLAGCAYYPTEREEADALYRQARHNLSVGREALSLLDRAIALAPERAEIYETRGGLHRDAGRQGAARDDYAEANRLRSTPDLLTRLGAAEGELGFLDRAEAALGEAIRQDPGLAEAYLQRARFRRLAGRHAEADRDVEAARARGAGWAEAFHNEGVRQLNHGRALDAERWFRFATDIDPLRSESWMGLGRSLLETNRPERAAAAFEAAGAIRKDDPETRYHRGNALRAIGRYEEALEAYAAAERLAKRPAYPTGAGIIYQQEYRDPARAEDAYARALAMEEAYPPALFNRAILYLELGRLDEAESDMRRSLSKRGSAEGARVLASILNELGKHEAAVNVCMEALEFARDPAVREGLDDELRRALLRKEPR